MMTRTVDFDCSVAGALGLDYPTLCYRHPHSNLTPRTVHALLHVIYIYHCTALALASLSASEQHSNSVNKYVAVYPHRY